MSFSTDQIRRDAQRYTQEAGSYLMMYKLIAAFTLLFAQNVYAFDPVGHSASREVSSTLQISCPATDFAVFIRTFANDISVQQAFTKYPLKKQRVDLDAKPEPIKVIQELGLHQIQFPVLPLHEERVKRSLEIRIDSVTAKNARITLLKPDTDYQVGYGFELDGGACWYLSSVDDQSLILKYNTSVNWLESIFPSMDNCTPSSFYFDGETKRSNTGVLEKKGYHANSIDEYFAKYQIREKFFGFDAIEIAIPSNTDSIYTVTVQTDANSLADAIRNKTSYRPHLYSKKFKAQSAMAYLVPEGKNKSTFVCFTFDGGF